MMTLSSSCAGMTMMQPAIPTTHAMPTESNKMLRTSILMMDPSWFLPQLVHLLCHHETVISSAKRLTRCPLFRPTCLAEWTP